ncbi:serine protease inhibitor ecotin [Shewanella sp. VB17]|uniref:serine protease inhibitor ecotin n=1 Tax=Shewanella sp. VB17 TaxID=2739432 RepID=UPI00156419B5|nr:serine protease inhibitor ecotin [Shewanella sp. VB17]NRD73578.1 serine protease inhibitor ecotin [Shewanella sp. VB17]
MNSSPLNIAKHALTTTALAISLFSFNVLANHSTQPNDHSENNITTQTFTASNYQRQETTKMFPAPTNGLEQHILTLPTLDDESNYLLEIQIGQTKMVDCNQQVLSGELMEHSVKGWGYHYYQVDSINEGASTRMACIRKESEKESFVPIQDELKLNYDSHLAKVFYLPKGSELRYRLWRVDGSFHTSKASETQTN